ARKRRAAAGCVQLCQPGAASSARPSLASSSCHDRRGIRKTATTVKQAVRQNWTPLDCAGEVVAGAPTASAVLGAKRTAVDGTARLQSAVPLVRWLEHGRLRLGRDGVHQEPRAPA